jgi:two-component system, OmpR family, sensor kinase
MGAVRHFLSSSRGRLVLLAVAFLAVSLVLGNAALVASMALLTERANDAALTEQATTISNQFHRAAGRLASGDLPTETQDGDPVDVVIVDPGGSITARTQRFPFGARPLSLVVDQARADGSQLATMNDDKGHQRRVYATQLDGAGDVLVLSLYVDEGDTLVRASAVFGIISVALLALGAWLSHRLAGRALRPVHAMAQLASEISEHDLHRRVEVGAADKELNDLTHAFNRMLARLEGSFEAQRTFTAEASQELRAPLALMRSELERGLRRTRTVEDYREVLRWALEDVERMGRLVDQLLVLTRADAGTLRPIREPVDVADFLYESAAHWERAARSKDVAIEVEAPESGSVLADPTLLRRVVDSLLDNAIRHAPATSRVRLSAVRAGPALDIEVADRGPGIPADFRPRLFSRFARADGALAAGGGAGLSLAVSAAIAHAHGGWLDLVERDGPGATFRLHLPDVPAAG